MSTGLRRSSRKQKAITADELRKSSIKSAVKSARDALKDGFERRLALLGIFSDGKRIAREEVADQWAAQRDRPGIEAALGRWEQQGFDSAGAVERFIREASYTWLNRLVGHSCAGSAWSHSARSPTSMKAACGRRLWRA